MYVKKLLFNISIPLLAFFGLIFVNQSHLREDYTESVTQLPTVAHQKLDRGEEMEAVTKWVVNKRNELKVIAREKGGYIAKRWAEERNRKKYNNPIGPSYDMLFTSIQQKAGGSAADVNLKIIDGSGRTNAGINSEAVIFGWIGRGMLAILLGLICYRIYNSEMYPKRNIVIPELGRIVGGIVGGSLGVYVGVSLVEQFGYQEQLVTFGRVGGTLFSVIIASLSAFIITKLLSNARNTTLAQVPATAPNKEAVLVN